MKKIKRILSICLSFVMIVCMFPIYSSAASYTADYKNWSQGASDNAKMRAYGCWVVSQAKLIAETGINNSSSFNPDVLMNWQFSNGYLNSGFYQTNGGYAPVAYAKSLGNNNLQYLGVTTSGTTAKIWDNISKGYYSIIKVIPSSGGTHYCMIANSLSSSNGALYMYDTWSQSSNYGPRKMSYSTVTAVYSYSYSGGSSTVTPLPTITYSSISEKNYKIQSATGIYLTVDAGGNSGANVFVSNKNSSAEQNFRIQSKGNNQYYIRSLANSAQFCVNAWTEQNVLTKQSDVKLYQANEVNSKFWGFQDAGGGYYYIRCMMNPNFVLTADSGNSGANVTVMSYTGYDNQKWKLETIEEAPVQKEYTITYKWEGGSGGPSTQKKPQGEDIEIFDDYFPNRFGYSFVGWSTSENADKAQYIPGSTFTKDADTTLYAVWSAATELSETLGRRTGKDLEFPYAGKCRYYKITPKYDGLYRFESTGSLDTQIYIMSPKGGVYAEDDNSGTDNNFLLNYTLNAGTTYYIKIISKDAGSIGYSFTKLFTVTYNANGGSGAPETQYKLYKTNLKLSTDIPTREGYTFLGWTLDNSAKEATVNPGATFTGDFDIVLYAVWEKTHEHSWTWVTEAEATCTEDGNKYQSCECGATQNSTVIPTAGHNYGEWFIAEESADKLARVEKRTCSDCGEIETREAVATTPILPDEILYGDAYSDGIIDELDALVVLKYAYGWTNVEIDMDAADAFKDGSIDELDAINILKKAYGWNIVLG